MAKTPKIQIPTDSEIRKWLYRIKKDNMAKMVQECRQYYQECKGYNPLYFPASAVEMAKFYLECAEAVYSGLCERIQNEFGENFDENED